MSNKNSDKIIMAILKNLYIKDEIKYSTLTEKDKTNYILETFKKYKIIYSQKSQELIDIGNLNRYIDNMKQQLEIIYNSNLYANNQTKLSRINKNIKNIFLYVEEFTTTLLEFKKLLTNIEKNYIKNIDKIKNKFLNYSNKKTRKKSLS